VVVRVDDQGPGFPATDRESLLKVGALGRAGGHGLGLPLAERFVRQQGGQLVLLDAPGGGARVEAHLPASGTRTEHARGFHG
jgi:signal transduction histidine kinase